MMYGVTCQSEPNTGGCFLCRWPLLSTMKSTPKKLKNNFFPRSVLFFKGFCAYYFTVYKYLAIWRAVKLGIFTHFTSTKLPWCSQSINSLMYVYYTDSQLLLMSTWSQLWLHVFILLPRKKSFCITPCQWCNLIFWAHAQLEEWNRTFWDF